jgi:hypothetical protein
MDGVESKALHKNVMMCAVLVKKFDGTFCSTLLQPGEGVKEMTIQVKTVLSPQS